MQTFCEMKCGLVIPFKPEPPKRTYKALELTEGHSRSDIHKLLATLLNHGSLRGGGIVLDPADKRTKEARRSLILFVARELLGDDFDYEELC